MPQPIRFPLFAALAAALSVGPALAETLRCRSVNGNTTCSGSGAVSCQTINGRTTCVSGGGGVVQRFGGPPASAPPAVVPDGPEDEAEPDAPERRTPRRARPGGRLSVERRSEQGALSLERDGGRLRLRSERFAVDPDD